MTAAAEPELHLVHHRHAAGGGQFQRQRQQRRQEHDRHLQQGGQLQLPSHDHRPRRPDGHQHVNVTVNQTLTAIAVSPASVVWTPAARSSTRPRPRTSSARPWLAADVHLGGGHGAGTISTAGLLTAPDHAGRQCDGHRQQRHASAARPRLPSPTTADGGHAGRRLAQPGDRTTTCNLSVLGADDAGESNLTYTWSTTGTPPAAVSFQRQRQQRGQEHDGHLQPRPGTYSFQVTITDPSGESTTSSVNVTVNQTLTAIAVSPRVGSVWARDATQQFTATAYDQFGTALSTQPTFTWAVATAPARSARPGSNRPDTPAANATVTAASGGVSGTGHVHRHRSTAPTVAIAAAASPNPVTGTTCSLSVLGADSDGGGKRT